MYEFRNRNSLFLKENQRENRAWNCSNARMSTPIVEQLDPAPNIEDALRAVSSWPTVLLFDSARPADGLGEFSFLTADPFYVAERQQPEFDVDPFADIRKRWNEFRTEPVSGLPPFQGGAAGMLSYELGGCWERIPQAEFDEFQTPVMVTGLFDWVLAWDHRSGEAWIISQGYPESNDLKRRERAAQRIQQVKSALSSGGPPMSARRAGWVQPQRQQLEAPIAPAPGPNGLLSNFTREQYLAAVAKIIDYIHAGDIFQANLSQRLIYPVDSLAGVKSADDFYIRLRRENPAPFAAYFSHDDWSVLSASPERFVSVDATGNVSTRPIKGTRQRRTAPEADLFTRDELRESEKDQAENVMIVDLLRNDLSRVCQPGSITVPELCSVETYETVQHLVSEVRGQLKAGKDGWDLLSSVFPGGSITGAPKIRAMEIIAELEPTRRGPYCGSLFYLGFDGTMDSSILIRTFTCRNGWIQCPVGGGIVAQSESEAEYEETLHKAEGMLRALRSSS